MKLYELFKSYRNSVNTITKLTKANKYCEFFQENKGKLNRVSQGIKKDN